MGVEPTSSSKPVKHLPNLLRNEVNSQQYPSVYEDRRPKSIENTEKTDGKGIASGQKGPWDQRRDQQPQAHACRACCKTPGREPG